MLARWPDDRNVLSDLSELLFYNWHFDEAATISGQGLDLYPDDLLFGSFYGTCLAYTGRASEALDASRAYVERHPENPNAWDDLGLRYLGVGLPDSAEIAFRKAWEMDEYFWRGVAYCDYCRGDVDSAIETFEQTLRQGGISSHDSISVMTDVSFWPGLSFFYAEQGRFTKALALFDDVRQNISGPETMREIEGRIKILLRAGRAEEALSLTDTLYDRAAIGYERLSAIRYRARALVALDLLEAAHSAAAELREEEETSGRSEPFLLLRVSADIALAEDDHESVLSAIREMQHHGVPLGGSYDIGRRETLAQALRMSGKPREAADVLEELVKIYGSHALAHYELGQIYEEMGRAAHAAQEYEDFLTSWSKADDGLPQVSDARARLTAIRETRVSR
jgi:tetratricopeptide (TPR) repeat protein